MVVTKHKKTSPSRAPKRSALSQQVTTRLQGTDSMTDKYEAQIAKKSTKEVPPGMVSKKITEGLIRIKLDLDSYMLHRLPMNINRQWSRQHLPA